MNTTEQYCCSPDWSDPSIDRNVKDRLRTIVRDCARLNLPLDLLEDSTDLYRAGMSSQASVMLMVAVESNFGIEFPDAMLSRDVFRNIDTIASAIDRVMHAEQ